MTNETKAEYIKHPVQTASVFSNVFNLSINDQAFGRVIFVYGNGENKLLAGGVQSTIGEFEEKYNIKLLGIVGDPAIFVFDEKPNYGFYVPNICFSFLASHNKDIKYRIDDVKVFNIDAIEYQKEMAKDQEEKPIEYRDTLLTLDKKEDDVLTVVKENGNISFLFNGAITSKEYLEKVTGLKINVDNRD